MRRTSRETIWIADHAFPKRRRLAELETLTIGMPRSRRGTVLDLARALSEGKIDLSAGADREEATITLERVSGIGPWASAYFQMSGLSDPDAFLASDRGVRMTLMGLGVAGALKSDLRRDCPLVSKLIGPNRGELRCAPAIN